MLFIYRIANLIYILAGNAMYGEEFTKKFPEGIVIGPFTKDNEMPPERLADAIREDLEVWPWGTERGDEDEPEIGSITYIGGDATICLGGGKYLAPISAPKTGEKDTLQIKDRSEMKGDLQQVILPNPQK